jgi:hypothetical protein
MLPNNSPTEQHFLRHSNDGEDSQKSAGEGLDSDLDTLSEGPIQEPIVDQSTMEDFR